MLEVRLERERERERERNLLPEEQLSVRSYVRERERKRERKRGADRQMNKDRVDLQRDRGIIQF